jgi:hypothetical protein
MTGYEDFAAIHEPGQILRWEARRTPQLDAGRAKTEPGCQSQRLGRDGFSPKKLVTTGQENQYGNQPPGKRRPRVPAIRIPSEYARAADRRGWRRTMRFLPFRDAIAKV